MMTLSYVPYSQVMYVWMLEKIPCNELSIFSVAREVPLDHFGISLATTLKPAPSFPARAAPIDF